MANFSGGTWSQDSSEAFEEEHGFGWNRLSTKERFCSVLNVVVDHSLKEPTEAYEPEDVERQSSQHAAIQVPVLRVFGPIHRGDNALETPRQSACLHIHGAYPYMLARPRTAGPDGSGLLIPGMSSSYVNWDDPASVQDILPNLTLILEEALQSMDFDAKLPNKQREDGSSGNTTKKKAQAAPILRQVTLVQGRGFYSYCCGPPAPFLRVEYYQPQLRWKVKLCLEKGLETPLGYHPDPSMYGIREENDQDENLLRFHCYEAHIPYSMQFFKDWNLAGMAYIHLQTARFRGRLPKSKPNNPSEGQAACFFESNTAAENKWDKKRETSCRVELDCHVSDILNIRQVLQDLPSDPLQRDEIQWRAVPSLQEIWRQERRRMEKLLHPDDNFLSQTPSHEVLTLNVKKDPDARRPGARLAAHGMAELIRVTSGLEPEFIRALNQILDRHSSAMQRLDDNIGGNLPSAARKNIKVAGSAADSATDTTRRTTMERVVDHSSVVEDSHATRAPMDSDSFAGHARADRGAMGEEPSAIQVGMGETVETTPTDEEAREALTGLIETAMSGATVKEPTDEEALAALQHIACESTQPPTADSHNTFSSLPTIAERKAESTSLESKNFASPNSSSKVSREMAYAIEDEFMYCTPQAPMSQQALSFASSQEVHQQTPLQVHESPLALSQKLDQGEPLLLDRPSENLIDPETLRPYETCYFGSDRCRTLYSVDGERYPRICGGPRANCPRPMHLNSRERVEEGIYQTVITGSFVDGIFRMDDMGDSESGEEFSGDEGDDSENGIDGAGKSRQQIATQEETAISGSDYCYHANELSQKPGVSWARTLTQLDHSNVEPNSLLLHQTIESDEESDAGGEDSGPETKIDTDDDSEKRRGFSLRSASSPVESAEWDGSGFMTIKRLPPHRNAVIQWRETGTASSVSTRCLDEGTELSSGKYSVERIVAGGTLRPLGMPPTRWEVDLWQKRREKASRKRKRASTHEEPALEIDGNSRKIVARLNSKDKIREHDIEEVKWEASQEYLQPSQLTPSDDKGAKPHASESMTQRKSSTTNLNSPSTSVGSKGNVRFSRPSLKRVGTSSLDSPSGALDGIGAQGGRIHVSGGGALKAKTMHSQERNGSVFVSKTDLSFLPSPISFLSVEIHVQCRAGESRLDSRRISMVPNSSKDKVASIVFVYGVDPGGGEPLKATERGILFVPLRTETIDRGVLSSRVKASVPPSSFTVNAPLTVECVKDERSLLIRFASIVRVRDPDMIYSWDTQGVGLGYIIERGAQLGKDSALAGNDNSNNAVDMVRLLGRTPNDTKSSLSPAAALRCESDDLDVDQRSQWKGSGMGSDWDDRVGAGAAASSIVGRLVFAAWKLVAEEVKHGNASYQPAIVAAVLNRRIPLHDELTLTKWYASERGRDRWRVFQHRLVQAAATMQLFDALDIIGRAGEAARLSGVEFSQSFPGIRGSQYKVEGVLLRALQSLRSDERGSKIGNRGLVYQDRSQLYTLTGSDSTTSRTQSPWKVRRNANAPIGDQEFTPAFRGQERSFFFYSPSLHDANRQEALEVQALTLEPMSGHYEDPVVVCDFTALYPSLVIAYNLCYSTCAGKLEYHSTRGEMRVEGRTTGRLGPFTYPESRTASIVKHHMKSIHQTNFGGSKLSSRDRAYLSPTGALYVSEDVVKGVLPQVLDEILTTRAMLKRAAKEYKKHVRDLSPAILRQLEARQLALKYVANVTYGYTSATFSGRCAMPLLADTIVECGRKTLRRAIDLANRWGRENPKWIGAKVIYGDTDSVFIKLPGRSYKAAFKFGEEFVAAVTAKEPPPVQLKLEKVYVGSIMQTMKRYCGMKYESPNQKRPVFEAKGLETVRRDQCMLTQKVLRNALVTLFKEGIEAVKAYLFRQWAMIFAGNLPVSDFILTGRVRSKYRGGKEGPVQAVLARRMAEADPGRVVRHKERIPYVIVATPGVTFRLKDCVLTPLELLERWDAYAIHTTYYITKRCLGLPPHNVDISVWYESCPKPRRRIHYWPVSSRNRKMITSYFGSDICSLCQAKCSSHGLSKAVVCSSCRSDPAKSSMIALSRLNTIQERSHALARLCAACNLCFEDMTTFAAVEYARDGSAPGPSGFAASRGPRVVEPMANCVCIDCPNTYDRHRLKDSEIEALEVCRTLDLTDP